VFIHPNQNIVLKRTIMPLTRADSSLQLTAGEALTAGDLVNVYNDAGTMKARKAIANVSDKEAHGYVVSNAALSGVVRVYFSGVYNNFVLLTLGLHYLSASVAGRSTVTPPNISGGIVQKIGTAVSSTQLIFNFGEPIGLA
jgi:hypothetical protein